MSSLSPNLKMWLLLLEPVNLDYQFRSRLRLLWLHKSAKCRVANGTESNGLNRTSRIRGIVEKGLGHLFITSNSSHFFNKTDFEQCLFNLSWMIDQYLSSTHKEAVVAPLFWTNCPHPRRSWQFFKFSGRRLTSPNVNLNYCWNWINSLKTVNF